MTNKINEKELDKVSGGLNKDRDIYVIDNRLCIQCGECMGSGSDGCITDDWGEYRIDQDKCTKCGMCANICQVHAIGKITVYK